MLGLIPSGGLLSVRGLHILRVLHFPPTIKIMHSRFNIRSVPLTKCTDEDVELLLRGGMGQMQRISLYVMQSDLEIVILLLFQSNYVYLFTCIIALISAYCGTCLSTGGKLLEHTNAHLEGGDTNSSAVKALSGGQISFKTPSLQTVHQFNASDRLSSVPFQTPIQLWHHFIG